MYTYTHTYTYTYTYIHKYVYICRIQGKISLLGVSAKTQSWLRLRLMGIAFGGVLSLLGLFARFLHLTAFLLFVLNTRVLTIAHIDMYPYKDPTSTPSAWGSAIVSTASRPPPRALTARASQCIEVGFKVYLEPQSM